MEAAELDFAAIMPDGSEGGVDDAASGMSLSSTMQMSRVASRPLIGTPRSGRAPPTLSPLSGWPVPADSPI
ncbi:hypothetical protein BE20_42520 [Sorangium cellulosum]|uniref:Uncharacterized protein n=1 Tax=Sorangium cellulosum TaxID=56 RepID=A0A150RR04_SORCE|nr:hypothetical protein BE18_50590 [Sorangium cellulosum]KYF96314.1 hypothetical protein BE20_42520 [Sorangium cellulosum]